MYRIDGEGICIILMYVDDNLIVGSKKAIDKATKEIKEIFSVTVSPIATEYLGCEMKWQKIIHADVLVSQTYIKI